ncbi:UDP-N-acetylglucosamine 2-epimerase (non-hydrolyzing) [Listeria sp. FSL L7-1509]|uniref:UDP-N-acetylglucosamine 2-epimerase (non-hydrolyzing) n=1 Tax=Listeria immobilis TaxID=2713502 RepID=A0ABR6SWL0_9LIST|nr:UDP-N-acetylglucosamine 2-epimerase (non-hydrolyzing) [Listeria immobilis]MBC1482638.1 UDP-N-acetylglucosamine 2-epimerase (non-hydrolyzing) [Listeria immobilis]MBC1507188.1 UDP-N-acetylglucosamine 2-epimerase (non-hydrolyzing) [Listeria immobilis]MBC1509900.1 UDP-N-acetylglucosamine 2-epimerase (non-hydrolyzing) [Listeria immobilis]MBC6302562.1 UDP-N-acetylglucosamine 2-epimerase (non-hydrolyzing) [Listeria immobilis]MBC6312804.1 UDP-N-acetylglucosamine 2-epimerase (non-hydrolyzing) [Liste
MAKIKVMSIFGTRPEAIKMAPLVLALEKEPETFESTVVITAQHREMLDQVLKIFQITPDIDLDIMKKGQTLAEITSRVMNGINEVIIAENPDIVLVHGDTTTSFAAGLAAFYQQKTLGHVEAGLRTWNKYSPFPEEMNRELTGVLADLHFSPTIQAKENLIAEGKNADNIFVTGNTAIDALKTTVQKDYHHPILEKLRTNRLILMTAHRRENLGEPMQGMFEAVREIVEGREDVELVYPMHLNPAVREKAIKILGGHERIHLIEPLDAIDFHNFLRKAYLVFTDSGGVQEEAPGMGVPVLVLRDTTERPEGIEAGTLKLVGTQKETLIKEALDLLDNKEHHDEMAKAANPYGDGNAAKRILEAIKSQFNETERPADFIRK